MPNIGPLELAIVAIIALIIFGPKRLPELGRSLGNGMREFKSSISGDERDDEDEDFDDDFDDDEPPEIDNGVEEDRPVADAATEPEPAEPEAAEPEGEEPKAALPEDDAADSTETAERTPS